MNKTVFKKDGHEVVLTECCKIVNGVVKNFCIEETGQYFENQKRGIRAANDLLLRKTLTKFRYEEKKQERIKRIGANKIVKIHTCLIETIDYVKRWDGILYLETKKNLVKELEGKVNTACKLYDFKSADVAIAFLKRTKR